MTVLVTGGAGFIGSTIVDQLVQTGHAVLVVDALLPDAHRSASDGIETNPGAEYRFDDLTVPGVADAAVEGIDAVCHQASMVGLGVDMGDVTSYVRHNDLGTAELLAALHRRSFGGPLVLASSMTVYGEGRYRCPEHGAVRPGPRSSERLDRGAFDPPCPRCGLPLVPEAIDEDTPVDPRNVYAATKLHQEHLCAAHQREHGGAVTALRYHNVYGPRMPAHTPYAGVASIFRSAAERGEAAQVFEDGGQRRDFIHVADIARANVAALGLTGDRSTVFNVATGDTRTILDLAEAVAAGHPGAPDPRVVGGGRLGDVRHVFGSPDRAALAPADGGLGFRARIDFGAGMAEFATAPLRR